MEFRPALTVYSTGSPPDERIVKFHMPKVDDLEDSIVKIVVKRNNDIPGI
jgi:hypothetical protein